MDLVDTQIGLSHVEDRQGRWARCRRVLSLMKPSMQT
jgi:hypothetical protein